MHSLEDSLILIKMIEKIGTIKNPLTIIAIFAGIAEISGTGVLIFINNTENQKLFIWFVMIFPMVLICLFFLTLNFNHTVLYAPSDFKDERNFFKKLQPTSNSEEIQKLKDITNISEVKPRHTIIQEADNLFNSQNIQRSPITDNDPTLRIRANYLLAEKLALFKINQEFDGELTRHVSFRTKEGKKIIFDGVIKNITGTTIIEIEFIPESNLNSQGLINTFSRIIDLIESMDNETSVNIKYLIAIVSEVTIKNLDSFSTQLQSFFKHAPAPIELKCSTYQN